MLVTGSGEKKGRAVGACLIERICDDHAGNICYVETDLMSGKRFGADGIDVRSSFQIGRMDYRNIAARGAKDDVGIRDSLCDAVNRFHIKVQLALYAFSEGHAISSVAAEDANGRYVPDGCGGKQLRSRMGAAPQNANGSGTGGTEVTNSQTSDGSGSNLTQSFTQNNAFKLRIIGRPNRDDLRVFLSIKGFIGAKAGERLSAKNTTNRKDEVAIVRKRDMMSRWGNQVARCFRSESGFHDIDCEGHRCNAIQVHILQYSHRR